METSYGPSGKAMVRACPHGLLFDEGEDLFVLQNGVGALRTLEDLVDELLSRLEAAPFEPEHDVRLAAHRADLDRLLAPEQVRRHARVDEVREHLVAAAERLDDGGGVDARP